MRKNKVTYNPRHLMVKLNGTQVVEMSVEGEEAASVRRPDVCKR